LRTGGDDKYWREEKVKNFKNMKKNERNKKQRFSCVLAMFIER